MSYKGLRCPRCGKLFDCNNRNPVGATVTDMRDRSTRLDGVMLWCSGLVRDRRYSLGWRQVHEEEDFYISSSFVRDYLNIEERQPQREAARARRFRVAVSSYDAAEGQRKLLEQASDAVSDLVRPGRSALDRQRPVASVPVREPEPPQIEQTMVGWPAPPGLFGWPVHPSLFRNRSTAHKLTAGVG